MRKVYLVTESSRIGEAYFKFTCRTKKLVTQRCHDDGYKYDPKGEIWFDKKRWRSVEMIYYYE